jgi:hypothetical protein
MYYIVDPLTNMRIEYAFIVDALNKSSYLAMLC